MKQVSHFFFIAISVVIILIYGKGLIMPFVLAMFLWFMTREIRCLMNKVPFLKNIPFLIKNIISFLFISGIVAFFVQLISSSLNNLVKKYSVYQKNIDALINKANDIFQVNIIELIQDNFSEFNIGSLLSMMFNSITEIVSSGFMILLYALFLFLEETSFRRKMRNMFKNKESFDMVSMIIERIEISVAKYLGLKTLISLGTAILSYGILILIGIESPIFWASLVFILNFIPNVGSLLASIFPALFSLLQFGEFLPGLMVMGGVGLIQIVVGNIVEPKLMGNTMNISPLLTIFSLAFWGAIWGITGMILSVPIMVTVLIIFSQFEQTKSLAILFSEKGEIN